jgi:hypothetical protein
MISRSLEFLWVLLQTKSEGDGSPSPFRFLMNDLQARSGEGEIFICRAA